MGIKRAFDEEDFHLSSLKQAKQLDSDKKQTSLDKAFSPDEVSPAGNRGEAMDDCDTYELLKGLGNDGLLSASSLAEKELETSAPSSWVTSSSSEEDAGSGEPFYLPLFPEYLGFDFPRQAMAQFEDAYSSLMSCSPRKQIPIGPNHQAEIPPWDPQATENNPLSPDNHIDDDKEQSVGTCIISTSLSNYSSNEDVKIGQGRKARGCLDGGSVRCVRQHVKEARDKLREVIGDENFLDLGFYDMGEEVAAKWTEEEECVFHKVIYSNPLSLGKNFWKQLSVVFPSRTSTDIVSYYFNVFMLRRRAVQNRTNLLAVDSDDDEWQGNDGGFFRVVGEDEDSGLESFENQDIQEGSEDDIPFDNEDDAGDYDDEDDGSDDSSGDGEVGRNTDVGAEREDAIGKDDLRGQILKPQIDRLHNYFNSDHLPSTVNLRDIREDYNVQEDSGTSSENQLCVGASSVSCGLGCHARESMLKDDFTRCLAGESNGSSDGLETGFFLLEPSDAKVWDESSSTVLSKGVDLLPTCNIIEEIFGPCTSKSN
ncbi:hypothetical protein ACH5RR_030463 [Cinchona calisaya]|uniref:ELM2 domain-containing protein n=1 Tax=Cinchona calisaya TaxID=153742 RepID=A0ABD2YUP0_9GENT